MELSSPVTECKRIGPKTAQSLAKLGIRNIRDLLYHYPRGYEDRTKITPVEELTGEMNQLALVTITSPVRKIRIRGGKVMIQADAADDSGRIQLCFFNQEFMKNVLREGESYYIYGKATGGRFVRDMINPEVQAAGGEFSGEILPLYPLTEGVRQSDLRKAVRQALDECLDKITDSLPNSVRMTHGLATARFAMENIHFPTSEEAAAMARKRLIFGEFFLLAAGLKQRKDARVEEAGKKLDTRFADAFVEKLPFALTGAQDRTLREICADLASGFVMSRLVQGDVGSGKTAVAAAAAFVAIQNGLQAAVM
ncbi:MAG: ATP-dependent DNA helicase RecG, partial [Clostridia bacterium]|nr:ATP-dependent DNA helicase RecG [Clostridia bacterium]